jgi:hypothetical protein
MLIPAMENTWHDNNNTLSVTIKQLGDNFYSLKYDTTTNNIQYEAVFVSVANTIFLDLVPTLPDSFGDNDYRSQVQPLHSIYKVNIENDTLKLAELKYGYFYNQFTKKNSFLSHAAIAGGILVTASSEEFLEFIAKHIHEPELFDDAILLIRTSKAHVKNKKNAALIPGNDASHKYAHQYIPEFPHRDGWLGGDADVSVAMNNAQSLYIFGDTYVGQKNDSRRSEDLKMVSSSVAIATSLPNGKKEIRYYWRNMYSNHPEPVFRSFTNRYKLWVSNAFLYKNCLYVLMQKTGEKAGRAPDDFFPFSILGLTLAKVVNPSAATPDNWQVGYIPISLFAFPNDRLHVTLTKEGNYLYLFVESDSKTKLLRVDLDYIDSLQNHLEYYSLAHTWKTGLEADDMEIVLSAQPGSTVNYHDELKKWVMVCGPGFMNNKIGLRTASSLTGPWSDETIVYECPEITPGSASYNPSDFCYFGRECFQNYDEKKHIMVITYDINSSDLSEIISNSKIYTPKVITVELTKYGFR